MKKTYFFTQQVAQYCISKHCYTVITFPIKKNPKKSFDILLGWGVVCHSIVVCHSVEVLAAGGLQEPLWEETGAALCWTQPVPETYFRKGKTHHTGRGTGGGRLECEKQQREHQGQRRRRGKRCPGAKVHTCCSLWTAHAAADFFLEGCSSKKRAHVGTREKCERQGAAESNCTPPIPPSPGTAQRVE